MIEDIQVDSNKLPKQTFSEYMLSPLDEKGIWISVMHGPPPPMLTVWLAIKGKVYVGWNESCQPEEDPSYCSWEHEDKFGIEGVTHYMMKPDPPKE